jgi:histidine triad (HIT) family protein
MYNHEPKKYDCPFCTLSKGGETKLNRQEQIVYQNKKILAFVSPRWWIDNPGHIIIVPKVHVENIYDIPDNLLAEVSKITKKVAIALKYVYKCDGISIRQHNEPDGGQEIWHFHVHVFPRYKNDRFYLDPNNSKFVDQKEMKPYAMKLKKYFAVIK